MTFTRENVKHLKNEFEEVCTQHNFNYLSFNEESRLLSNCINQKMEFAANGTVIQMNSVATVLLTAASLGLSFSTILNHLSLSVDTFNDDLNLPTVRFELHITYRGLLHLGYETGAISNVQTWVVYTKDKLQLSANEQRPLLTIDNIFADRGEVAGSVCIVAMASGEYITSVMSATELDAIAALSGNPGWFGCFADEFRKKQVIKRALRNLPSKMHPRMAQASKYLAPESDEANELSNNATIETSQQLNPVEHLSQLYAQVNHEQVEAHEDQMSNELTTSGFFS